jgi:hypothetical protein
MKKMIAVAVVAMVFVAGVLAAGLAEKQPYMKAALNHLQQAKAQLEKATHDKGGHRATAIRLINQAIAEVNAGITYDSTHPEKPAPKKAK